MAQQLRAFVVLTEDPGSVPSTQMVVPTIHNYNSKGSNALFRLPQEAGTHPFGTQTHKQAKYIYIR